ncbi:hypothetical protein PF010_g14589 [Phytophthora fragariae]|uniref:Uncharacterized protein n=1 Tax=Phytophthora fragariae TaxID=53985 RepID=A0A6G0KWE6_9STRA|nr:hypothetical protein PF010_g14589 [Phytophthora fragariae]
MNDDATAFDTERAAFYVATVRPAMAVARYVRAEREEQERSQREKDQHQAGEGAMTSTASESTPSPVKSAKTSPTTCTVVCTKSNTSTSPKTARMRSAVTTMTADTTKNWTCNRRANVPLVQKWSVYDKNDGALAKQQNGDESKYCVRDEEKDNELRTGRHNE